MDEGREVAMPAGKTARGIPYDPYQELDWAQFGSSSSAAAPSYQPATSGGTTSEEDAAQLCLYDAYCAEQDRKEGETKEQEAANQPPPSLDDILARLSATTQAQPEENSDPTQTPHESSSPQPPDSHKRVRFSD